MVAYAVPLFHRGHYNILAKQFREHLKPYMGPEHNQELLAIRGAMLLLILGITTRLVEDNPDFNPLAFLDKCSPDPDVYPLSELWEAAE